MGLAGFVGFVDLAGLKVPAREGLGGNVLTGMSLVIAAMNRRQA